MPGGPVINTPAGVSPHADREGLVLTLPIQAVVALAIRIRMGRPVLFRQTRPGLHAKPFEIVKFRTMLNVAPERVLMDDAIRMTPLSRWLRATSLDELPTLWNVVRGDMSMVGPRPLLINYLARYSPEQAQTSSGRREVTVETYASASW